jgi:hypothetical protein
MWRRASPVEPAPAVLFRINAIQHDHVQAKIGNRLGIRISFRQCSLG